MLTLEFEVGAISKKDLAGFLRYAKTEFDLPIIESFLEATPTAELEPITDRYVQSDEQVRTPELDSPQSPPLLGSNEEVSGKKSSHSVLTIKSVPSKQVLTLKLPRTWGARMTN